jgi:predicted glycosyltransferase
LSGDLDNRRGARGLRVWIDLANSPHPLLFAPVATALEASGASVLITARDHAQTLALTRERWSRFDLVGGESPSGAIAKARTLAARVRALRAWAVGRLPDVALSHNSYAQIAAARSLGIPAVTAMDYERQPANHVAFRLATSVLLPEAVPSRVVRRQGAGGAKVRRYPGLKEALYVGDFEPNPGILSELGIARPGETAVVVARTPPGRALYHRFENPLFAPVIEAIARQPHARCVILPRHLDERDALERLTLGRCLITEAAIDARSLIYEADLVLGAGGTMTREAALMGVPTVSLFAGPQPAVDRWLEERGALRHLSSPDQLPPVRPRASAPRTIAELRRSGQTTLAAFLDATVAAAQSTD